jgi:hypothetical protein
MELPLPNGIFDLDHQLPTDQFHLRSVARDGFSDRERPCGTKNIFVAHDLAVDGFVFK